MKTSFACSFIQKLLYLNSCHISNIRNFTSDRILLSITFYEHGTIEMKRDRYSVIFNKQVSPESVFLQSTVLWKKQRRLDDLVRKELKSRFKHGYKEKFICCLNLHFFRIE